MARYDGIRFGTRASGSNELASFYAENRARGFGEEVKRRILFGTYMLTREKRALYYDAARAARAYCFIAFLSLANFYFFKELRNLSSASRK